MPARAGNAVWIDVLPSMVGFATMLAKAAANGSKRAGQQMGVQLERVAKDAGKAAGEALAAGVEDAKDRVKDAADDMTKAHEKVADAAGRVTVAEAKLAEARKKYAETSSQVITAQERLASATRAQTAAERNATRATEEHDQATVHLAEAQRRHKEETERTESALQRMARSMSKVDTKRIDQGTKSMAKFGATSYAAAAGIAAIGTSLPAIAGLTTLVAQASGSALLLPGAFAAGGVAAGTLKLGLSGVADALKEWDDAEKFNEKIGELSGNARAFAVQVRELRPELIGLRNTVQDRMFAGTAEDVRALAKSYLPVLRKELGDVGGVFALARQDVVGFATSGRTVRDVAEFLNITEQSVLNVRGAIAPLLQAFLDVAIVGGAAFSKLIGQTQAAAEGFAGFVANARATGQIDQWIDVAFQTLSGFRELLSNIGAIFRAVFSAASAQGGSVLDTLNAVTGSLAALLTSTEGSAALTAFFTAVHTVVENLLPGLRAVMGVVLQSLVMLAPQIPPIAKAFSDVAISVAPLLPDLVALAVSLLPPIVGLVQALAPAAGTLAAAFIGGYVALVAYNAAVAVFNGFKAIVGFVRAWAAGQVALNLAMDANPIAIIVVAIGALVAAIIYLWNHNEGFRNFFINAWAMIKSAVASAWSDYIKPAFSAIVTAVKAVGDAAVWLWRNAFVPAWSAIVAAASAAWSVLSTVYDAVVTVLKYVGVAIFVLFVLPFVLAFQAVRAAVLAAWEGGIKPSLEAIGNFVSWVWTNHILPWINLFQAGFRIVGDVAMWLWQKGIQPAFDGIKSLVSATIDVAVWYFNLWVGAAQYMWSAIQSALAAIGDFFTWVWETRLSPIISGIVHAVEIVGAAFMLMWTDWVRPALQSLGDFLSSLWDVTIGKVFGWIRDGVTSVGGAFDSTVGWIERAWGKLREILAKPVNFLIQTVYNDGIRSVWNKVADFVGISGLPEMKPIAFAGGGVVSGYAPGRDTVPALLSPGEAVLVPEAVRLLGARNILALNAATSGRPGNVVGGGYSGGGIVHRFAGGGVIGTIASWVGDFGQSVMDLFTDPAGFVRSHLAGGGGWTEQLALLPGKVIGKVSDFLWSKIKSWFGGDTPSGGDQLGQWITAGMRIAGVPGTWFNPLQTLIMRESGGNPNAINLWDSNAQAGHPSQGLMQTIPSTFAAYRDPRLPDVITDPVANIVAGIRYILDRYGSIFSVQQAVGSTPMGYDRGGYLMPGVTTVFNGTRRPEPVLTAGQWDALQRNDPASSEPLAITGTLDLGGGLEARIDGRIFQSQQQTGAAIAARRRF